MFTSEVVRIGLSEQTKLLENSLFPKDEFDRIHAVLLKLHISSLTTAHLYCKELLTFGASDQCGSSVTFNVSVTTGTPNHVETTTQQLSEAWWRVEDGEAASSVATMGQTAERELYLTYEMYGVSCTYARTFQTDYL